MTSSQTRASLSLGLSTVPRERGEGIRHHPLTSACSQLFDFSDDAVEYSVGVLQDIGVPEAQDVIPAAFEVGGAGGILVDLLRMLPAVNLDHKLRGERTEIDVGTNGLLAAKLYVQQLATLEVEPQPALRVGLRAAQLARAAGSG